MPRTDDEAVEGVDDRVVTEVSPPVTHEPRAASSWLAVLLGAVFVIVVTGIFSYVMSEDARERANGEAVAAFGGGFTDDFNRPADTEDLVGKQTQDWKSERGGWGVQSGLVYLPAPDPDLNVAVVEANSDSVSVQADVSGFGVCGVVARYSDPENYVGLVRAHGFGVFNIVEVVRGKERIVGTVPDVDDTDVNIGLVVGDDTISARVGFQLRSIAERSPLSGTQAGLIAQKENAGLCLFDNVGLQEPR